MRFWKKKNCPGDCGLSRSGLGPISGCSRKQTDEEREKMIAELEAMIAAYKAQPESEPAPGPKPQKRWGFPWQKHRKP
ncbi:hypothetical protein D7X33_07240 [Butyricicoccus sp. 1XD8-22]|nr:hypothetical protein D7X33_07240 [Butyricicoccus sp. 1XD8-22]